MRRGWRAAAIQTQQHALANGACFLHLISQVHACMDLAAGSLVAIKRIKAAHLDPAVRGA